MPTPMRKPEASILSCRRRRQAFTCNSQIQAQAKAQFIGIRSQFPIQIPGDWIYMIYLMLICQSAALLSWSLDFNPLMSVYSNIITLLVCTAQFSEDTFFSAYAQAVVKVRRGLAGLGFIFILSWGTYLNLMRMRIKTSREENEQALWWAQSNHSKLCVN